MEGCRIYVIRIEEATGGRKGTSQRGEEKTVGREPNMNKVRHIKYENDIIKPITSNVKAKVHYINKSPFIPIIS